MEHSLVYFKKPVYFINVISTIQRGKFFFNKRYPNKLNSSLTKLLTYPLWAKLPTLSSNGPQDFSGQRYVNYACKPLSSLLLSLLSIFKTRKQTNDIKQGNRKVFTVVHRGQFHQDAALSFDFSLWPHAQMISCHWESRCLVPRVGQLPCCQGSGLMGFQNMKASCLSKTAGNTW